MKTSKVPITSVIGRLPYRLALAGGWIDQPFVSRLNPKPPGAMVVVNIEPTFMAMDRAGMATGTRYIVLDKWGGRFPKRPREQLVRDLYHLENDGKKDPSGSQDMAGLIYPGINRLDFDYAVHGGVFPSHIESLTDARHARWLEKVIHIMPVAPRPPGYNPLGRQNLDPKWIARLGRSGTDTFEAIRRMDLEALGAAMNDTMLCWDKLMPDCFVHPTIQTHLRAILRAYQRNYPGAVYSGCGGGYLYVVSKDPVPGSFRAIIRTKD